MNAINSELYNYLMSQGPSRNIKVQTDRAVRFMTSKYEISADTMRAEISKVQQTLIQSGIVDTRGNFYLNPQNVSALLEIFARNNKMSSDLAYQINEIYKNDFTGRMSKYELIGKINSMYSRTANDVPFIRIMQTIANGGSYSQDRHSIAADLLAGSIGWALGEPLTAADAAAICSVCAKWGS